MSMIFLNKLLDLLFCWIIFFTHEQENTLLNKRANPRCSFPGLLHFLLYHIFSFTHLPSSLDIQSC
jgi:hypothetical protein